MLCLVSDLPRPILDSINQFSVVYSIIEYAREGIVGVNATEYRNWNSKYALGSDFPVSFPDSVLFRHQSCLLSVKYELNTGYSDFKIDSYIILMPTSHTQLVTSRLGCRMIEAAQPDKVG